MTLAELRALGNGSATTEITHVPSGDVNGDAGTGVASILGPFYGPPSEEAPIGPAAADGAAADSARLQAATNKKPQLLNRARRQPTNKAMRVAHGVRSEGNRRLL